MKKRGYAPFEVPMTIHFHRWLRVPPVEVAHFLDFSRPETSHTFAFRVEKTKLKKI